MLWRLAEACSWTVQVPTYSARLHFCGTWWLREALRDVRARDAASTFERAPDRFPSSSIRRGAPDASSSSAARVVVPALGSFRFPKPSAIDDAGADATIDPGAEEINHSERLRRLASAKRDPAVADALGKTFNDKALKAFHSPMRKHLTLDPLISEYSIDSPEGVALMSLAEALIRTPKTAKDMPRRLLRDTLAASHLDFLSHFAADKSGKKFDFSSRHARSFVSLRPNL